MIQVVILLTGAASIGLITLGRGRVRRLGFAVGLVGQPFWIAATWASEQWGMLVLAVYYTGMFLAGALMPEPDRPAQ